MKTFESFLLRLGFEDREIEHFISCDECSYDSGYEYELERCTSNPQRVHEDERHRMWMHARALMALFKPWMPPQPMVTFRIHRRPAMTKHTLPRL